MNTKEEKGKQKGKKLEAERVGVERRMGQGKRKGKGGAMEKRGGERKGKGKMRKQREGRWHTLSCQIALFIFSRLDVVKVTKSGFSFFLFILSSSTFRLIGECVLLLC